MKSAAKIYLAALLPFFLFVGGCMDVHEAIWPDDDSGESSTYTISVEPSTATISDITYSSESDIGVNQSNTPSNYEFPYGLVNFTVSGLDPGETATITVTLPEGVTDEAAWFSVNVNGFTQLISAIINGSTVTFTVTDGGVGDADGAANGVIDYTGGLATYITISGTITETVAEVSAKPGTQTGVRMAPITNATITIYTMAGVLVATTTSDENGSYSAIVEAGYDYIIRAQKGNVVLTAACAAPGEDATVNINAQTTAVVMVLTELIQKDNAIGSTAILGESGTDASSWTDPIDLASVLSQIEAHPDLPAVVTDIETDITQNADYTVVVITGSTTIIGLSTDNAEVGSYDIVNGISAIVIDTTPPSAPSVTASDSTSTFTWSWTSGGGGNGTYRYKLDNTNLQSGATQTTETSYTPSSALSAGTHTLFVQERDDGGNWSDSGTAAVFVGTTTDTGTDTTPPSAPSVTGSASTPDATTDTTPTWSWTSGGGGIGIYRLALNQSDFSTVTTTTSQISYTPSTPLSDGSYTLYVQERDAAGNWSDSGSFTTTVTTTTTTTTTDTTPPDAAVVSTSSTTTTDTTPTITGTAEAGSTVTLYDTDGTTSLGTATAGSDGSWSITASTLSDAAHTLTVKVTDSAGNTSTASTSITITVDTTAPSVNAGADSTTNAQISQDATVTGATTYQWSDVGATGNITFGTATSEDTTISASSEATYTIRLTATDSVGNSAYDEMTFVWDATAPTITFKSPLDSATDIEVDATVSATFSKAMDTSTFTTSTFRLNDGSSVSGLIGFTGDDKIATFTPDSNLSFNTSHTATVTTGVTDVAGNALASSDTWSFTTRVEWILSSLDTSGSVGMFTSIALDSADKVHISYEDDTSKDLKYATNASGSWVITSVDSADAVGEFTSIALDSADKVHISYEDDTNTDLKYATNASGSWVLTSVDTGGDVGMYTSIAVDSADKVHISYQDMTNADLKYATNASGSWVLASVDTVDTVGGYTSIAVDSADKVHISYKDLTNADLKYATNASGSWVLTLVDSVDTFGGHISMDLDSADKVHISYQDSTNYDLWYATNASGSWVITSVATANSVGKYSSIALDSADKVHISYQDTTNFDLLYATNASGSWVLASVDTPGSNGYYTSIAVDSADKVHIGYTYWSAQDLKYATNK